MADCLRERALTVHVRAPLRVDFAGGWTDVALFASRSGGVVVNAAIELYAWAEMRLGGGRIRLHAEDLGERVTLGAPAEITYDGRLDLHKAALNMLPVTGGIEILTRCDAPAGSGLGASGALDVALVAGLARCRRETYSPEELAELGFQLETAELGLLGGRQDQYAAALGGCHEFRFDGPGVTPRRLDAGDGQADLENHLVLCYTGQSHFSSATHGRVWEAYAAGDPEVSGALETLRDLASAAAAALEAGDWRRLGRVVDENWRAQQRLDATISTPGMARIEDAARQAGAWGLKATGAGAGGCVLIVCAPDRRETLAAAVEASGGRVLPLRLAAQGVSFEARISRDHADGGD